MGTKKNPGSYDCYANAELDEPMFVLLARDRLAPLLVEDWAQRREGAGDDPTKVHNARVIADEMRTWYAAHRAVPVSKLEERLIEAEMALRDSVQRGTSGKGQAYLRKYKPL